MEYLFYVGESDHSNVERSAELEMAQLGPLDARVKPSLHRAGESPWAILSEESGFRDIRHI